MSQRYRNFLSWLEARRAQITQKDKDAHTRQISKHQGMQDAVQHYKDQLLAACTSQWLRNKQQLHGQVVQRAEQLALEAMDQLQDTLGSLLKLKGKLSVSTTVCGLGAVWSLFNALDKWEPTAARGNGRLSGKLPGTKGPDALVPETRDLTMKQMVEAAMDCGPVPRAAAQLVVWGGALGVSAVSTAASVSEVPTESWARYWPCHSRLPTVSAAPRGALVTVCATASRQAGSVDGWTSGQRTAQQQTLAGIIAPLNLCCERR
jgi:hypothetical protein